MICVGNFKSLQSALQKPRFAAPLEVHTWLRSEIGQISPFVDWLMSLIARSHCVLGSLFVLTCRQALSLLCLYFSLSCTPAGDVIQSLHEEPHRTIARATGGGH
jgi:hypothetical protein